MSQAELCSGSRESLVIHGANSVCGPPPAPWWWTNAAISVFLAMASAFVFASPRARHLRRRFLSFVLVVSLPGLAAALFFRADGFGQRRETSRRIASLETSMHAFAHAHGCAVVTKNDCLACEPIARFATAHAGTCTSRASIELGRTALDGTCAEIGSTLRCGAP